MISNATFYKAPWSHKLLGVTLFILAVLGFIAYRAIVDGAFWGLLLVLGIVLGALVLACAAIPLRMRRLWYTALGGKRACPWRR